MPAQFHNGHPMSDDQVDALVLLLKSGATDTSEQAINDAIATGILDEA
jgi:hypothetical protein